MSDLRRHTPWLAASVAACACVLPTGAAAQAPASPWSVVTGGASPNDPALQPPGKARIVDGKAVAPAGAPKAVVAAIAAANRIATKPYRYGGGHRSFRDTGYDCSGSVSYALRGARLLRTPLDSTGFMRWGERGKGDWITVYANGGHAFAVIAGLRWDTSMTPGDGPGWSKQMRSSSGFRVRHPAGL